MKDKILFGILFVLGTSAHAVDIVHDPGLALQNAANEVVNLGKWAASEAHEASIELSSLNTYENTVLQVERMGDPKTLTANLPGVANVQELSQIVAQAQKDVADWSAYVNPQSWQLTTDSILNIYQQPGLPSIMAANGVRIGTPQSLIQFSTADYNTAYGAQQTVERLNQQLQTQTQQLAQATSKMQAATTQSEVQKYQATISALHAAIDATKAALQQAELSEKLQVQQNNNAQQLTRDAETMAQHMADLQVIDQGLSGLPMGNFNEPVFWGGGQSGN